jgi:hypothetical protein
LHTDHLYPSEVSGFRFESELTNDWLCFDENQDSCLEIDFLSVI